MEGGSWSADAGWRLVMRHKDEGEEGGASGRIGCRGIEGRWGRGKR